jgi:hypothetical protein
MTYIYLFVGFTIWCRHNKLSYQQLQF